MTVNFLQFLFNLLIAGFVLRFATAYLIGKDSELGKALSFIY